MNDNMTTPCSRSPLLPITDGDASTKLGMTANRAQCYFHARFVRIDPEWLAAHGVAYRHDAKLRIIGEFQSWWRNCACSGMPSALMREFGEDGPADAQ